MVNDEAKRGLTGFQLIKAKFNNLAVDSLPLHSCFKLHFLITRSKVTSGWF